MKTITFYGMLTILCGLLLASCSNQPKVLVQDQFEKDAAGWKIQGDAKGSGAGEPEHSSDGGVNGGYIHAKDDVSGGVWYFEAPEKYLGNKKKFYGATLKYYLYQHSDISNQFEREDVLIKSDDKEIYYTLINFPDTTWTPYRAYP